MNEFDKELYKCKAVCMDDDETVVCGYYYQNVSSFIDVENVNYAEKLEYPITAHEINIYTLCRNTGIKLSDGTYLYEYDIVELTDGFSAKGAVGIIEWDEWAKAYGIRGSANYPSKTPVRNHSFKVVGNVVLHKDDLTKFQVWSDAQEGNEPRDVKIECRSTQHLNKLAKQHLPRG